MEVVAIASNRVPEPDGAAADRVLAVNLLHEIRGERALEEMRRLLGPDACCSSPTGSTAATSSERSALRRDPLQRGGGPPPSSGAPDLRSRPEVGVATTLRPAVRVDPVWAGLRAVSVVARGAEVRSDLAIPKSFH